MSEKKASAYPDIPNEVINKWQKTVDVIAELLGVPSGLVMLAHPDQIEVIASSNTLGNPFKKGDLSDRNSGLYCERVIQSRAPFHIPNSLIEPECRDNPQSSMGMISYYGCPLIWPDGTVFGTICILDNKEHAYSQAEQDLVEEFAQIINDQLRVLHDSQKRSSILRQIIEPVNPIRRTKLYCFLSIIIGMAILCSFSIIQKSLSGYPILNPKGYFVPIIFGGLGGLLICFLILRINRQVIALKKSLKEYSNAQNAIIQREIELSNTCNELSRKNTEIEDFNRIMVNREERMIELKNRINELSSQLELDAPFSDKNNPEMDRIPQKEEIDEEDLDPVVLFRNTSVRDILHSFTSATGVAAGLVNLEGEIILAENWQTLCTDFHRANEETCKLCVESDHCISKLPAKGDRYTIHECPHGLSIAASPIIVNERHVANVFIGQFFLKPPELDKYRIKGKQIGFETSSYLDAVKDVRIVPQESMEPLLEFVTATAQFSAEMGMAKISSRQAIGKLKQEHVTLISQRRAANNLLNDMRSAEAQIKESENRFKTLTENSNDLIMRFDKDHRHVYVNSAIHHFIEKNPEDLIGKLTTEIGLPEKLINLWDSALEKVFESGKPYRLDFYLPAGIYVDAQLMPEFDDDGKVVSILSAVRDITERRKNEADLRDMTIKLQQSIEAANIGLWDWNIKTGVVKYSTEWKQQIGYQDHEIEDKFEEWQSRVHPDDLQQAMDHINEAMQDVEMRFDVEFRFKHKDGHYIWIQGKATKLYVEDNKPVRMVGSHVDITKHKEAEEQLKAQIEELSRWHAITLDREDRVQQLKQEVNELQERLGESHRYEDV